MCDPFMPVSWLVKRCTSSVLTVSDIQGIKALAEFLKIRRLLNIASIVTEFG